MKHYRFAFLFLLPLVLLASSISAATSSLTIKPGDTLNLHCSTTLIVTTTSVQDSSATCKAVTAPTAQPATPAPTSQPSVNTKGLWFSQDEIRALPMSGPAWDNLKSKALSNWGSASLKDLNSQHDTLTLAGALYYARTGETEMRKKVADAIMSAIGTEDGGRTLEASRNIVDYVISADLIDLQGYDSAKDAKFKSWLSAVRTKVLDDKTIISTHETRPNNWGTHAGATRVAIDRYIGDNADLARAAKVFQGWLGDRSAYAGFKYGELDWQANQAAPVGINPKGSTIQGKNVDGVLPDDQRRAGGFTWPPQKENYTWEALQGATVQAWLLHRAGYDVFNWSDKALYRATYWLFNVDSFPAEGDDTFIPWIINKAYSTSFPTRSASIGKNMGFTDWTFSK
jgi:hypothetical protein